MDHDNELERMRERLDPAEQREPVLPERGSQEWCECLERTFLRLARHNAYDIAQNILDGKISSAIRSTLRVNFDDALREAAE